MNRKQEIQEKLEHIKKMLSSCNSNIEDYKADAENYECEIMQLEKQLKECDELKLVGGWYYDYVAEKFVLSNNNISPEEGRCYPTKELASIAMSNSNTRNKLEAYSRVVNPEWIEKWDGSQNNYYVYLYEDEYDVAFETKVKDLGTVYMSEKAAKRIAKALNNSEITL